MCSQSESRRRHGRHSIPTGRVNNAESMSPCPITVVIAARNAESTIERCLAPLMTLDRGLADVVVVNDASTDRTTEIVSRYVDSGRIRLISNEKQLGRAESRNRAIRDSFSRYIAIQDADDISAPTRFASQLSALERDAELGAIGTQCVSYDPNRGFWLHQTYPLTSTDVRGYLLAGTMSVCHTSAMIRATVLEKVGLYDPSFERGQDLDLFARIAQAHTIQNLPQFGVLYEHPVRIPHEIWLKSRIADARVGGTREGTHSSRARYYSALIRRELRYARTRSRASRLAEPFHEWMQTNGRALEEQLE
jgi:glycosyltransferase involved in cell wall biosynthesis